MIAPRHDPAESPAQRPARSERWHPAPGTYRPPEATAASLWSTIHEAARGVASKHPVWVIAAAASLGALLGCLVKKR